MLNFPDTPVINDTFTAANDTWRWDGTKWILTSGGPFLPLAGGTLLGPLILSGDPVPTAPLMPVTLQYFNTHASPAGVTSFNTRVGMVTLSNADVVAVLPSSAALPLMDGAAAAGSLTTWSRGDHQHPTDTSRVAKIGDTMTGTLNLAPAGANAPSLALIKSSGGAIANQILGYTAGSLRWQVQPGNGNVEGAGNAGSDFGIYRYDNSGNLLGNPFSINRATGNVTIAQVLTVNGPGIVYANWNTHQIAVTWDGTWLRPYVDGTLVGSAIASYDWANGNFLFKSGDTCTGSLTVNGNLAGGYVISTGSMMCYSGTFYVANNGNYYLARNGSDGYWRFVENGTVNLTIETGGNIRARMDIQALGGWIYSAGMVYAGYASFNDMYFGPGASGRTFNWASQCYFDFDPSAQCSYVRFGSWIMSCRNDAILGDNTSYVAGNGPYSNWSDERIKKDIEDSRYGLADILQLRPRRFTRKPHPQEHRINRTLKPEIGFVAQEVADIIPEAVTELAVPPSQFAHGEDKALALQSEMILAAAINAIKELSAEIEQLKRRIP